MIKKKENVNRTKEIDVYFEDRGVKILLNNKGNPNTLWMLTVFNKDEMIQLSIPGKDGKNFAEWLAEKHLDHVLNELNNWSWNFNENAQKIKKILQTIVSQTPAYNIKY